MQQRLARVLVSHRRDLDGLTVDRGVELKVQRPHHLRRIRGHLRCGGRAGTFARAADRHLQPLLAPQPVHLLLVHRTALVVAQRRPGASQPVAPVVGGVGAQPGPQISVRAGRRLRDRGAPVGKTSQPNRFHANRSDILNVCLSMSTARRLAAGLRIFPWPPPAVRPSPARPRPTAA
jgi:hypothetical protein